MVLIPFSKIKENIAKLLLEEGFITAYKITVQQETKFNLIEIELKYNATKDSVIRKIKRISRPGLRIYKSSNEFTYQLGGQGMLIISTKFKRNFIRCSI